MTRLLVAIFCSTRLRFGLGIGVRSKRSCKKQGSSTVTERASVAQREWTPAERMRAGIAYWVLVAACLVMSSGGVYLIYLQERPAREARQVAATIERLEVIPRDDGHGHVEHRPLVLYSYSVDGVRYTTDRLTSLSRQHDSAWIAHATAQFHVGQSVTAYVHIADPGFAFLVRDHDWRAYAFSGVTAAMALGLAAYWPWAGLRQMPLGSG
jgi:Protein of unknown function (DUF3592)